nr:hypothetical protein [Tanacetum cinerariifolium]
MNLQVHKEILMQVHLQDVKDDPHNEDDDKDKFEDDSSPKEVNAARKHVNTASLEVNTGHFKLNVVDPSLNITSSSDLHSPTDMFKLGASDTLEATNVEFYSDRDAPKVNLGNNPNSYGVPTTSHTRIYKHHPIKNVTGEMQSSVQTRRMTKPTSEKGNARRTFVIQAPTSLDTCRFALWKESHWKKWVFRNKKDERGIVIRNKARLAAQGRRQEEGLDYEEVFALVARIKANRLFLAYASFMGFLVYQMDVKSAFLYGTIEEEVYVTQPPGFKDPDYPNKVLQGGQGTLWAASSSKSMQKGDTLLVQIYVDDIIIGSRNKELCTAFEKLIKDKFQMSYMGELTFFLGLKVTQKEDGIFINQDKYVKEILKKFNYSDVKSASTPVDLEKHLVKDGDVNDVDVHIYRSMIGYLMYLTASRPDIMFVGCSCSRFQVTPKTSHLLAMANLEFCEQHNMVAFLEKPQGSTYFHQIVDFLNSTHIKYALTENPVIYVSLNRQFWETASSSMLKNMDDKSKFLMYPRFIQIFLKKHKRLLKPYKLFSNMRRVSKGYYEVDVPLFPAMLVQGPVLQSDPTISPPLISLPLMVPTPPHDSPLPRGNAPGSKDGRMTLNELTALCTSLSKKVESLESDLKSATKPQKVKGVAFRDVKKTPRLIRSTTTLQPLPSIDPKDKGNGVLVKEELVKVKRRDQGLAQIESDAELARRLYEEELAEVDRAQKERQKQDEATIAVLTEEFDEIQLRMDVNHKLAARLTYEEQKQFTIQERAKLLAEFFKRRKKQFAAERSEAIRNKPPIRTQLYKKEQKWIDGIKPVDDDSQQQVESSKKRQREAFDEESSKKQKLKENNDAEKEKLRAIIDIVPRDDIAINVEYLA